MHRTLIIWILLAVAIKTFGQNSLPVQFGNDPSRNTSIGTFVRNGVPYGSINDLAQVLGLKASVTIETKKLDLQVSSYTVKLTAGSPFVVVVDKNENANLLQMPVNVLYGANAFFVPMDAFVPVLRIVLGDDIAYDRTRLLIGRAVAKSAFDVAGVSFEEKSNGVLVRIQCTKKLADCESFTKPIGNDTWLYVTIANARANVQTIRNAKAPGIVKQVLAFQYPTSVQLTIRLKGSVSSSEIVPAEGSNDILITVQQPTEEQAAEKKVRAYEAALERERDRWKLDVVVIDPGHGGDDPGAIGIGRTKEKDITLAIALKLGKLIEKNLKDVDVVYTRKKDEFVELYRRGQIANENGGKLFISIHCNSMPHKPDPNSGFEIYLLRPGKTESALRIAERENEVVKLERGYEKRYQKLTEENFILLSMAQSAYVKYSEKFADILQHEMGKRLDIANDGVKQAGFYVLVGASMPNVLVETAYLSNRHDERILKSAKGQQKIAEAIFGAVKRYKAEYEKSLKEGVAVDGGTR